MNRIYIAGPCSGLPELNYPAFNRLAAQLRALGHHVESPAENPIPPCGTWEGYMRMGLAQLDTCEGIVMLPGWEQSPGAQIERLWAGRTGKKVFCATKLQELCA